MEHEKSAKQGFWRKKKTVGQKAYGFLDEPGGIRTPDPRLRRPLLYPTELLIHSKAGDENRTHVFSLEG